MCRSVMTKSRVSTESTSLLGLYQLQSCASWSSSRCGCQICTLCKQCWLTRCSGVQTGSAALARIADTVGNGQTNRNSDLFSQKELYKLTHTKQMGKLLNRESENFSKLPTCIDEALGFCNNRPISLSSCFEVLQYIDIRSKMQHVLFSTAVWHLQQLAKTIKRLSQQVTYNNPIEHNIIKRKGIFVSITCRTNGKNKRMIPQKGIKWSN